MNHSPDRPCGNPDCHIDRERKMVTVALGVFCDPCIAPIVRALNEAGLPTKASCCGHGFRPGSIVLRDGREIIIARGFTEARSIGALFPLDINGNRVGDRPSDANER